MTDKIQHDGDCKDHASKKKLREVVRHGDTAAAVVK